MKIGFFAAAGLAAVIAVPSQAAVALNGACASDLTLSAGSTLIACYGRYDGNALSSGSNGTINAALDALGYLGPDVDYAQIPKSRILSPLSGSKNVDFPGVLNGIVYLGLHFGNGSGGPGNTTSFYKILASDLDVIKLNLNASSNAVLLSAPAVPEPATWALMIGGFGLLGAAMRRRRRMTVSFA